MVSLVIRAKDAVGLFEETQVTDLEAEWLERSRAAGVFYANNFSEKRLTSNGTFQQNPYASTAALRAASTTGDFSSPGVREVLLNTNPAFALSGGKSIEIKTYGANTAANGGNWQNSYKDDNSSVNGFYFQFAVYMQRDALAWPLPSTDGQMKVLNLEQFGGGQVVVMASKHYGFPTLLLNGSGLNERFLASVPYKTGGDWFYQTAIDSGSSLAGGTRQDYIRRYGPSREIANTLHNYGHISGNATANLLYNRGFSWPNADALQAGAVPYNMDGWTVIEVYINNASFAGSVEPVDVVKMWVAPYGEEPTLVCDLSATPNSDPQTLGTIISAYQKFEILWYDTAFEGATEDVGYRPTQQRWYSELIGSTQPILFPGGHPIQGHSSYPSWIDGLEINKWTAVNLNTMSAVDSEDDPTLNPGGGNAPWHQVQGLAALTNAWNGGAFASKLGTFGTVCYYGGGHNAYSGSDIYGFDLETRLWSRISDPYTGPFNWPYATGVYPDGSPIPPHTYDTLAYHEASHRLCKLRSCVESTTTSSNSVEANHFQNYNFSTGVWTNSPAHAGTVHSGGFSVYDPVRQLVWVSGGSASDNFFSYDPVANVITQYNTKTPVMTDSAAAYDPNNDLFVVTRFRDDTRVQAWSLAGNVNNNTPSYLTEAGTPPTKESSHGWEWSENKQGFIYYRRNGAVYLFKHTSGTWNGGTWTWSLLTDAANSVVPPTESTNNGVYSRFQVCSYNNGQREVAIVCNSVTGSTYAFRIA